MGRTPGPGNQPVCLLYYNRNEDEKGRIPYAPARYNPCPSVGSLLCLSLRPGQDSLWAGLHPLMLLFMEKFLAGAVQWLGLTLFRRRLLKISSRQLKHLVVMTLCGSALSALGFFNALHYLDASVATILLFTNPIVVIILTTIFYREPLRPIQLLSLAACITGGSWWSVCPCQKGCCCRPWVLPWASWPALVWVSIPFTPSGFSGGTSSPNHHHLYQYIACLVSSFLARPVFLFNGQLTPPCGGWLCSWPSFLGTAQLLKLAGHQHHRRQPAALVASFELPCNVFFAALFLGERLTPTQLLGAFLVLSGVLLVNWDRDLPAASSAVGTKIEPFEVPEGR